MLIPWNTDAPIYHFPFVTIGLIVINTFVFGATLTSEEPEKWMLIFGEGLHPYQWITSVFMHADLMHLLGNMIFLWGFGLVIEGKLGWWRFALVYLGLGTIESAVVQLCMQHQPGFALGASGAIYGLLAMSLIWAPKNEMNCVGLWGLRPMQMDISILTFVTIYVGWELVVAWSDDFAISSSMLHLAGAMPGFALGIMLLKWGAVDCENWDIFAVLQGHEGRPKPHRPDPRKIEANKKQLADELDASLAHFVACLRAGHVAEALALQERMRQKKADWHLSQAQLLELIKVLLKNRMWSQSIAPMKDYLKGAADSAPQVRLKLAQILLEHEKRPGAALSVLEKIRPGELAAPVQAAYQRLEARARKAYADGDLEVDVEDW